MSGEFEKPGIVNGGVEGNIRGDQVEAKVAGILTGVPGVIDVKRTPKLSKLDQNMIDLVVDLGDGESKTQTVFVQVKASSKGVDHFKEQFRVRRVNFDDELDRDEWMMQNRMILIVGGTAVSRSGKTTRSVEDNEIIESFTRQAQRISDYHDQ